MSSIKKKAISGTIWTVVGYGGSQILRLGANIILTRLLVPELFGLMALMNTFITGLKLFSDLGVRPSIIRSSRGDDPVFINTGWTLQVIRGFGLWIACCIIAWPVAQLYDNPDLIWLLPIVGSTTIMSGFSSTALVTLNRKMNFRIITLFPLAVQIISLTVTIIWAYFNKTIWALVVGSLTSSMINMIISHRLDPKVSNRFMLDKESLEELVSFGRWVFLATIMTFLAEQTDKLLLGKFLSLEMLGVYVVAFTLADVPRKAFRQVSQNVMMPIIASQKELPRKQLRNKILKKRWLVLIALAVIVSLLFCTGDYIIYFLYDSRYQAAGWMLPILSLGLWPMMLSVTIDKSLYALGKPIYPALGNGLKFLYMLIVVPLSFWNMGLIGIILAIAFNDFPYYIAVNYGLWKEKLLNFSQDIKATTILICLLVLGTAIRLMLGLGYSIDTIPLNL